MGITIDQKYFLHELYEDLFMFVQMLCYVLNMGSLFCTPTQELEAHT